LGRGQGITMKAEEIRLDDLWRILIGEVPGSFFIEVIIRTAFIYLLLMVGMRLLGKRMAGQLNKIEMISLTTLAAAVGVPLQSPDRGLLPALIIAAIVVAGGRFISAMAFRSPRFEKLSQDELTVLVKDSVLQLNEMKRVKITRDRLFAFLRSNNIIHLGGVRRLYLEAGGFFTLVQDNDGRPGLIILPKWDTSFIRKLQKQNVEVCAACGCSKPQNKQRCEFCHSSHWVSAAKEDGR